MIKRLAHVCIHTENLEKSRSFYCDILGMEHWFDFQRDGSHFGFYLKAGNQSFIEFFKGEPGNPGNIHHLALEVDDLGEILEKLSTNGIPATERKLGADQSWQAWIEDPNGVRIELHQYTPESSQVTRNPCIVDW